MGDPNIERLEAEVDDARRDLAFEQEAHGVTLRRARTFELALGTISAMLGPDHPATGIAQAALRAGLYPATPVSSNETEKKNG